jgi:hypothetical protein
MSMTGFFFLRFWQFHIEYLAKKYSNFISICNNFLADQTFAILNSLCESIVLLVKAHQNFYPLIPLLPWLHDSEPVEHFFGIACQINFDFDFAELIQMVPKISRQYTKALRNEKLTFNKEKSIREGQFFE